MNNRNWTDKRTVQESMQVLEQLTLAFYEEASIRTGGSVPHTTEVCDLVIEQDWEALLNYNFNFASDSRSHVQDVIFARQILALYQKFPHLPGFTRERRQLKAVQRFEEAEQLCLKTNRRLRAVRCVPSLIPGDMHAMMFMAQQKVSRILGAVPSLEELQFCFGPGSNTNVKARLANSRAKLGASLTCSHEFSPTASEFLYEVPGWLRLHPSVISESEDSYIVEVKVECGKVIFVPKNATTDRSIMVEPLLNSFFQKGVGTFLRDRLLRVTGIDLRDQTRNQNAAQRGSLFGDLATIDLSMASDCMSTELVAELLPLDWFNFLSALRTGEATMKTNSGTTQVKFEKFSSMGNAFTFELESIIFYSLAWAATNHAMSNHMPEEVLVYGDDIIIPVGAYDTLERLLTYCGFVLNKTKSFKEGGFRESCGADFLYGWSVRPAYIKDLVSDQSLYVLHNFFVRNAEPELAKAVLEHTNPALRLWGPDGFGDGHLIGSWLPRLSRQHRRNGYAGGYFDTYMLNPREYVKPLPGDAILPTYSVYTRMGEEGPTNGNTVRGSRGYARKSIYTLCTDRILRRG